MKNVSARAAQELIFAEIMKAVAQIDPEALLIAAGHKPSKRNIRQIVKVRQNIHVRKAEVVKIEIEFKERI